MKPLFTLHAGEYLVGSEIERRFKQVNVWVPSRDTGIDLLVTDRQNRRELSLQVKFGKDWLVTHMKPLFQKGLRACGWWTINRKKLVASKADFWIFVLYGFAGRTTDFIVVPTGRLRRCLQSIHSSHWNKKVIQSYLWVTKQDKCWEVRDLRMEDQHKIANDEYENASREFTQWLNTWNPIAKLNK